MIQASLQAQNQEHSCKIQWIFQLICKQGRCDSGMSRPVDFQYSPSFFVLFFPKQRKKEYNNDQIEELANGLGICKGILLRINERLGVGLVTGICNGNDWWKKDEFRRLIYRKPGSVFAWQLWYIWPTIWCVWIWSTRRPTCWLGLFIEATLEFVR